jgi:hypothetical protein
LSEVQGGEAEAGERGSPLRDSGKWQEGIEKKKDAEMERNPLIEKCMKRRELNGGLEKLMRGQGGSEDGVSREPLRGSRGMVAREEWRVNTIMMW